MAETYYRYEPVKLKDDRYSRRPTQWKKGNGQQITRAIIKGKDAIHKIHHWYAYNVPFQIGLETEIRIGEYNDTSRWGVDRWNGRADDRRQVMCVYFRMKTKSGKLGDTFPQGDDINAQPVRIHLHIAAGSRYGCRFGTMVVWDNQYYADGSVNHAEHYLADKDFQFSATPPAVNMTLERSSPTGKWNDGDNYDEATVFRYNSSQIWWNFGQAMDEIARRHCVINPTYWLVGPYVVPAAGSYIEYEMYNGKTERQDISGQYIGSYPGRGNWSEKFQGVNWTRPNKIEGWVQCTTLWNRIAYQNVYEYVNCGDYASVSLPSVTCGDFDTYEQEY